MSNKETVIRIDSSKNLNNNESQGAVVNILCLDITKYSIAVQFTLCCFFVFIFYLAYGYFLELIFSEPEVAPVSLYITFIQFVITMGLSHVESTIRNPIKRK